MAQPVPPHLSEAEYLALERELSEKHEFVDGLVVAMNGGTLEHNRVVANMVGLLGNALRGRPCVVQPSDLKVKVESRTRYYYPDATVVCGGPRFVDGKRDTFVNPRVVVEVLSDSTEKADRGRKFDDYRQIPDLMEYQPTARGASACIATATWSTSFRSKRAFPSISCTKTYSPRPER
jgi:Uma2 family endonuclease